MCNASGSYVTSISNDRTKIDYCYRSPCGAKGRYTDGEDSYTCACNEGYELTDTLTGQTGVKDDLAGQDCSGEG